jgi:hypothetical protein
MDVNGMGAMAGAMTRDRQMFGAQVVSKTMDYMNNQSGSSSQAPVDGQTFGAAVVSKTMDYMNSGDNSGNGMSDMNQTYDFAKSVLSGYANGRGALADFTV